MIIIMKLLSKFVVLMLSILTLCIKCMNKINSASDYMFSNYKTEQFIYVHLFCNKPKQLEIIMMTLWAIIWRILLKILNSHSYVYFCIISR